MIGSRLLAGSVTSSIRAAGARRVIAPALRVSAQRIQSRQVHNRLQLPYAVEQGLGDFLPPPALKVVAEEYQQGLLDRLNEEVADTHMQNTSVAHTLVAAAQDTRFVKAYNYASEALNNSFFLFSLRPTPVDKTSHEDKISPDLAQTINADFGNLEQLKSTFSAAVNGISSQGYVWLLVNKQGHLAVYPTFGTGTLLVRSGDFLPAQSAIVLGEGKPASSTVRLKGSPSARSSPATGASRTPPLNPPTQTRSYVGGYQATTLRVEDGSSDTLYPLFCISVHEHAWMSAGYGVWGKEEWTKKFWSVVDWEQASQAFARYTSRSK